MLDKYLIPYNKKNTTIVYYISVLKEHYIYKIKKNTTLTIFLNTSIKHNTDTKHIQIPQNLQQITLDTKECNSDKDILATTPTIKTKRTNIYLFDNEGKYIHTTQRHNYNGYGHNIILSKKKKYIDLPLQNFEIEVTTLYQRYLINTNPQEFNPQNQYYINKSILKYLIDTTRKFCNSVVSVNFQQISIKF